MTIGMETLSGTVIALYYQSAGFCAGRVADESGRERNFAGKIYVREDEWVALRGRWVTDKRWGKQFRVSDRLAAQDLDQKGLERWLATCQDIKGVGEVRARKLVELFGTEFGDCLRLEPHRMADESGVPLDVILELAKLWHKEAEFHAVAVGLSVYELTEHQVRSLYARFKGGVLALMEDNPYLLVHEVPGLGFKKVDAIALKTGVPVDHPGRAAAAVCYVLAQAMNGGSTCQGRSSVVDMAGEMLGGVEAVRGRNLAGAAASYLVSASKGKRRLHLVECGGVEWLALPVPWKHESFVAEWVGERGAEAVEWNGGRVWGKHDFLDETQKEAVRTAMRSRACAITGGAGTGKTTLVNAIVDLMEREGKSVLLCAPTGKAARRMSEATGRESYTIHRALGWGRGAGVEGGSEAGDGKFNGEDKPRYVSSFARNEQTPLDQDVIVVDEMSMVDSELAYHLLKAVKKIASVVFVGDPNQLPPVGAGAMLRDLLDQEMLPLIRLGHCHRQAGILKRNANEILNGNVMPTEGDWQVAHRYTNRDRAVLSFEDAENVAVMVERLFGTILPERGLDVIKDVQFLTAMTKEKEGLRLNTGSINSRLQRIRQRGLGVNVVENNRLYAGDKVINTKNNYDFEPMLPNGHQGVVVSAGKKLMVDFDDRGRLEIPNDRRGDIELSYCLTIHKVQGAEFPCAVVICHREQGNFPHKNWLYTGVTRAMRHCIILGDEKSICRAARRNDRTTRRTLLPLLAGNHRHVEVD